MSLKDAIEVLITVATFAIGFAVFRYSKKNRSGARQAGSILLTYPDGKFSRKVSAGEALLFLALIFGFGGFCIWALFHFYIDAEY